MEVVNNIIDKSKIPIKFIDKPNGGKHPAWRVATKIFEGRYVVTCDDDDPITDNMLEVFDFYWKQQESQPNYDIFWEVRARAQYEDGKLVGDKLPHPYFDSDYNEVNFKLEKGAKWMDVVR